MLGNITVHPVVAVKNLGEAKEFYSKTLGLKVIEETAGGVLFISGTGSLFVYESDFAGSNKATAASWEVDDVLGKTVELKKLGVEFEHYDMPGVTREGDVHIMGSMQAAWFKDPAGNILCIGNAM